MSKRKRRRRRRKNRAGTNFETDHVAWFERRIEIQAQRMGRLRSDPAVLETMDKAVQAAELQASKYEAKQRQRKDHAEPYRNRIAEALRKSVVGHL